MAKTYNINRFIFIYKKNVLHKIYLLKSNIYILGYGKLRTSAYIYKCLLTTYQKKTLQSVTGSLDIAVQFHASFMPAHRLLTAGRHVKKEQT